MAKPDKAERDELVSKARFEFYTDLEIESLPEPKWLIHTVLMEATLTVLFGPPGSMKTFVALAWSFCLARNMAWLDRAVTGGRVIFAAGEGVGGLPRRVKAWKRHHGFAGFAGVRFTKKGLNLMDDVEVEAFIASIKPFNPVLVVVDTLARAMPGGDEDGARDMGLVVKAVDKIIKDTGAAVLVLHHPIKNDPKKERGSGALRGAADIVWRIQKKGLRDLTLVLINDKQKDAEVTADIHVKGQVFPLDGESSSCVIVPADHVPAVDGPPLNQQERAALNWLARQPDRRVRFAEWAKGDHGIPDRTFARVRKRLLDGDLVELTTEPGPRYYRLTTAGVAATANSLPRQCEDSASPITANAATPPIGGAMAERSGSLDHLGTEPLPDNPFLDGPLPDDSESET